MPSIVSQYEAPDLHIPQAMCTTIYGHIVLSQLSYRQLLTDLQAHLPNNIESANGIHTRPADAAALMQW